MHKRFLEKQIEKWQKERDEMNVVCDKARESLKKINFHFSIAFCVASVYDVKNYF